MEKSFFVTLAVLLPLWLYLVSFSTSSSTVTRCCQWVQLFCSFYNGVDIGGQIPWGNIDFQETVLTYLGSGVSDENFQRANLYVRPNYRYHPQLTVAVDDQQRFFISEPRHSITDTTHAEAKLIQFLNDTGQLSTIPYFNLTNSPCKECARKIIEAFKERDIKPDINILWLYGKGSKPEKDAKYMNAIMSLLDLTRAGFKVGVWDWKDYGEYLANIAYPDFAKAELEYSRLIHAKLFEKRTKITKDSLDTINSFDEIDHWERIRRILSKLEDEKDDGGGGDDGDEPDHDDKKYDAVPDDRHKKKDAGGFFSFLIKFFGNLLIYLLAAFNEATGWQGLIVMPKVYYITTTGAAAVLGWLVAYSGLRLTW